MKSKTKIFIPIFLSNILFLSLYYFSCSHSEMPVFGEFSKSPIKKHNEGSQALHLQKTFREIYRLYEDRVVSISTEQTVKLPSHPFFNDPFFQEFFGMPRPRSRSRVQKRTGLGTGFILSKDGYICTNHHVIAGVDTVTVKIREKSFTAKVIGSDERTDIALLKINAKEELDPVFLGDSDKVRVGDWAIAIGNPFGFDKTFTVGVVSATGRRDIDLMGSSQSHIQTDASINPGNSGGPLINIDGEVIGISRMIYTRSGGNMGIGFAIPINTSKSVLAQLKKYKKVKRGYIGVQIVPLTEEYAKELGLKSTDGALIGGLIENSPAQKGGLIVGDVIIKVGKKNIKQYEDLVEVIGKTTIGKTLKIVAWRKKSKINLFITVAERP
ncbi:MAG: trypsin-like peptidase domain-containing protein [Spirochaetota bacterium]|nr:trypsin-like peptidase domain-containing protein [Spirochaetota bacterium]